MSTTLPWLSARVAATLRIGQYCCVLPSGPCHQRIGWLWLFSLLLICGSGGRCSIWAIEWVLAPIPGVVLPGRSSPCWEFHSIWRSLSCRPGRIWSTWLGPHVPGSQPSFCTMRFSRLCRKRDWSLVVLRRTAGASSVLGRRRRPALSLQFAPLYCGFFENRPGTLLGFSETRGGILISSLPSSPWAWPCSLSAPLVGSCSDHPSVCLFCALGWLSISAIRPEIPLLWGPNWTVSAIGFLWPCPGSSAFRWWFRLVRELCRFLALTRLTRVPPSWTP